MAMSMMTTSGFTAAGTFAYHLDIRIARQQHPESLADQSVIIH
jgi:hypothetical protein